MPRLMRKSRAVRSPFFFFLFCFCDASSCQTSLTSSGMFDLGDTLFANTFKAQFEALRMAAAENGFQFVWENTPTYNPEEHIQSWFTVRI